MGGKLAKALANKPIGQLVFGRPELTHPLRVFQEAGYDVELVSTEGGDLMMDGYSNPTDAKRIFVS